MIIRIILWSLIATFAGWCWMSNTSRRELGDVGYIGLEVADEEGDVIYFYAFKLDDSHYIIEQVEPPIKVSEIKKADFELLRSVLPDDVSNMVLPEEGSSVLYDLDYEISFGEIRDNEWHTKYAYSRLTSNVGRREIQILFEGTAINRKGVTNGKRIEVLKRAKDFKLGTHWVRVNEWRKKRENARNR